MGGGEGCRAEVLCEADLVHKVQDELVKLSCWTIDFIANCRTLFTMWEDDDERNIENGNGFESIYKWRWFYTNFKWDELKKYLEPLVEKFLDENYSDWREEAQKEIIDALEILYSVKGITTTFEIR